MNVLNYGISGLNYSPTKKKDLQNKLKMLELNGVTV